MANLFTDPQYYQDIADAIRFNNGLLTTYTPPQMAQAILDLDIGGGEVPDILTLNILTPPTKTLYSTGEAFSSSGLSLIATYTGGYYKKITQGFTLSISDGYVFTENDSGLTSITATYDGLTVTISITVSPCKIVTWADGTDAEILAMIDAADKGKINLTDFWDIGDEREVSLSAMSATGVGESHVAQTVTMVLVAKDTGVQDSTNPCYNYQYVTPTSGRRYPNFIVQQKELLANGTTGEWGYMNNTQTNSGSWNGCARRTWCNNVFKNAIPNSLIGIFKQVGVKTIETYNGSTIQTSQDYFFLPAAAEVFKGDSTYGTGGTAGQATAYSNLTEFNALSRWQYYETTTNRIKKAGTSGSANYWWERSPSYNDSRNFCDVYYNDNAYSTYAGNYIGIAPCGAI